MDVNASAIFTGVSPSGVALYRGVVETPQGTFRSIEMTQAAALKWATTSADLVRRALLSPRVLEARS
jgi:hypothetical protein